MLDIVVFVEAEADFRTAACLADRAVVTALPWTADALDALRRWRGRDATRPFVKWTELAQAWRDVAPGQRRMLHGRFGTTAEKGEYLQARKALLLAHALGEGARAVLLVRDADLSGRRADFELAREHAELPLAVVIGVPVPEREAWHLAGFVASNVDEQARLAASRAALGRDATEASHTLAPKRATTRDGVPIGRSTKRVLDALTSGDPDREWRCIAETDLEVLRTRGRDNGLCDFLDDVIERLAPLVGT